MALASTLVAWPSAVPTPVVACAPVDADTAVITVGSLADDGGLRSTEQRSVGPDGEVCVSDTDHAAPSVAVGVLHTDAEGRSREAAELGRLEGRVTTVVEARDVTAASREVTVSGPMGVTTAERRLGMPQLVRVAITYPDGWDVQAVEGDGVTTTVVDGRVEVARTAVLFPPLLDATLSVRAEAIPDRGTPSVTVEATPLAGAEPFVLPAGVFEQDALAVVGALAAVGEDGADQLADGATSLADGADELAAGTAELATGVGELAGGTAGVADGAEELAGGAQELAQGAAELADGARQLSGGLRESAEGSAAVAAGAGQLDAGTAPLRSAAEELATGAQDLAAGADALAAGLAEAAGSLTGELGAELGAIGAALDGLEEAAASAAALADGSAELAAGGSALAAGVAELAGGVDDLATGTAGLATGLEQLAGASDELSAGASGVAAGTAGLAEGGTELADGAQELAEGSAQLADGSAEVADGADGVATGSQELAEGARELPEVLAEAVGVADRSGQEAATTVAMVAAGGELAEAHVGAAALRTLQLRHQGQPPLPIATLVSSAGSVLLLVLGLLGLLRRRWGRR